MPSRLTPVYLQSETETPQLSLSTNLNIVAIRHSSRYFFYVVTALSHIMTPTITSTRTSPFRTVSPYWDLLSLSHLVHHRLSYIKIYLPVSFTFPGLRSCVNTSFLLYLRPDRSHSLLFLTPVPSTSSEDQYVSDPLPV